jgi:hypothetical protein
MKPLTITKDEYSGKWVAWHLPSDKVVKFKSEGQSQVFWKCTSNFYLLGVGETKETAVENLESKVTDFTYWLNKNGILLGIDYISSNLPEYRQAIYEFNTQDYKHTDNV